MQLIGLLRNINKMAFVLRMTDLTVRGERACGPLGVAPGLIDGPSASRAVTDLSTPVWNDVW
jgi:hypothetical protein